MKVYIHTNDKQILGALLSKYLFMKAGFNSEIINISDIDIFQMKDRKKYLRSGRWEKYDLSDLQSFTLARFWPETNCLSNYIVVDPDVFPVDFTPHTVKQIIGEVDDGLFVVPASGASEWRSSVMIRQRRNHSDLWCFEEIIEQLFSGKIDYNDVITLRFVSNKITPISENYNHYDAISAQTSILHTTARITQPWKTGLPVDFANHKLPPLRRMYSKFCLRPKYIKHPRPEVENFFFSNLRLAIEEGFISNSTIYEGIRNKNIRPDILTVIKEFPS